MILDIQVDIPPIEDLRLTALNVHTSIHPLHTHNSATETSSHMHTFGHHGITTNHRNSHSSICCIIINYDIYDAIKMA